MTTAAAPATVTTPVGWRVVSAFAGVVAALVLAWGAWTGFTAALSQPVSHVAFAGETGPIAQGDLEAFTRALRAAQPGSLEQIRSAVRRVPWVRDATVRQTYPGTVEITLDAYEAFARWNDAQLVNREGEVFAAKTQERLPHLRGPEGTAGRVVAEYLLLAAVLAPLGAPITELRLSPRGAWTAVLASGMAIALGRGDWRARAERFVAAWPGLAPEARSGTWADLRYPGGFALRRPAVVTPIKPSAGGARPR